MLKTITATQQAFLDKVWAEMWDPSVSIPRCHALSAMWNGVKEDGMYWSCGRWVHVA